MRARRHHPTRRDARTRLRSPSLDGLDPAALAVAPREHSVAAATVHALIAALRAERPGSLSAVRVVRQGAPEELLVTRCMFEDRSAQTMAYGEFLVRRTDARTGRSHAPSPRSAAQLLRAPHAMRCRVASCGACTDATRSLPRPSRPRPRPALAMLCTLRLAPCALCAIRSIATERLQPKSREASPPPPPWRPRAARRTRAHSARSRERTCEKLRDWRCR